MLKKWTCFYCGQDVIEGQFFTFVKNGPVHLHCLEKFLLEKIGDDYDKMRKAATLVRALTVSAESIVKIKQLKIVTEDAELKDFLNELQKDEEKVLTKITKKINEML